MKTAYIVDLSSSIEKAYYELGIIETHSYITEDDLVQFIICRSTEYNATHSDDRHESNGDLNNDIDYNEFLMSNMMPQSGGLNRGIWKLVETYSRGWAVQRNTSVTVYAGPVYTMNNPTIGKNKVVVPHKFYKIVIDNKTKEVLAFLFEHKGGQGNDITTVQSTVAKIEAETGLKFPLPQGAVLNKSAKDFPVYFGAITNSKRYKFK
jgi:hypothetical protein